MGRIVRDSFARSVALGVALVLLAAGLAFGQESHDTAPAPSPTPSADAAVPGELKLWSPVDLADIPFTYACAGRPFQALDLEEAPLGYELEPPIASGGRVVYQHGSDALAVVVRDPGPQPAGGAVWYTRYEREGDGWRVTGWGDCEPRARFPKVEGLGGYWRLDPTKPAPGPTSRRVHLKVWYLRQCPSAVRIVGRPRVHQTDDAVLIAVPVTVRIHTDVCIGGQAERVTVRLPRPLGDRQLYDAGTLPIRPVGARVDDKPAPANGPSPLPAASVSSTLTPDIEAERPRLAVPLEPPPDRKPILSIDRPPDAVASKQGVRLELWVPRKPVRTGRWLPATMRITNLSGRPIVHGGQIGCGTSSARLTFDIARLFPDGVRQVGRAARFKEQFLEASRMRGAWMRELRPKRSDCVGSVGVEEAIGPGRAVTVPAVVFARYPWGDQPLPDGRTRVTASYGFSSASARSRHHSMDISAPVRIKGEPVEYPSPQAIADAMLTEPRVRAWVESRNERVAFYPSIDGPWRSRRSWEQRGYVGGPAPSDIVAIASHPGGRDGAYVRNLVVDAWTAAVRKVEIVGSSGEASRHPTDGSVDAATVSPDPDPSPEPSQ